MAAGLLLGREREIASLRRFLARRGGTYVITGEPGLGRTSLTTAATELATSLGLTVATAAGVGAEADLPYSALNKLLIPFALTAAAGTALSTVLGFQAGPPASVTEIATEVVNLLAGTAGVLLAVDDWERIDTASAAVLTQVAPRLGEARAALLITRQRPVPVPAFDDELTLRPLTDDEAGRLLEARAPELSAGAREQIREQGHGNPAVLLALAGVLPYGEQRSAYARAAADLHDEFLLRAALRLAPGNFPVSEADQGAARAAEHAGLIVLEPDGRSARFVHPLAASVIHERSTSERRRQVYLALAEESAEENPDDIEARAGYLARATIGPDEAVSALLERAAAAALSRGDGSVAVTALRRAAALSPQSARRGHLLLSAACVEAQISGDIAQVPRLVAEARQADPTASLSLICAVAMAGWLLNGAGSVDEAYRVLTVALETATVGEAGPDVVADAVHTLLMICIFADQPALWPAFDAAADRYRDQLPPVLQVAVTTIAHPQSSTPEQLARLDGLIAAITPDTSWWLVIRIAMAGYVVDRLTACRAALERIRAQGLTRGAGALTVHALAMLTMESWQSGRWDEAERHRHEGISVGQDLGFPLQAWSARLAGALLAAGRGDRATLDDYRSLAAEGEVTRGAMSLDTRLTQAAGLLALGEEDYRQAYQHLARVASPGRLAPDAPFALFSVLDFVEAALATGRADEAREHVAAARRAGLAAISDRLAFVCAGLDALVADDDQAGKLFEETLADPTREAGTFHRARIELAYGRWLRRQRRTRDSRVALQNAVEVFDRLGAAPWSRRARRELDAAAITRSNRTAGDEALTPQQLAVAELAAVGLTNREIAERLQMSHRTVGSHLALVFRRLGITSRRALADALRQ